MPQYTYPNNTHLHNTSEEYNSLRTGKALVCFSPALKLYCQGFHIWNYVWEVTARYGESWLHHCLHKYRCHSPCYCTCSAGFYIPKGYFPLFCCALLLAHAQHISPQPMASLPYRLNFNECSTVLTLIAWERLGSVAHTLCNLTVHNIACPVILSSVGAGDLRHQSSEAVGMFFPHS